jgi:hypothetical protein
MIVLKDKVNHVFQLLKTLHLPLFFFNLADCLSQSGSLFVSFFFSCQSILYCAHWKTYRENRGLKVRSLTFFKCKIHTHTHTHTSIVLHCFVKELYKVQYHHFISLDHYLVWNGISSTMYYSIILSNTWWEHVPPPPKCSCCSKLSLVTCSIVFPNEFLTNFDGFQGQNHFN